MAGGSCWVQGAASKRTDAIHLLIPRFCRAEFGVIFKNFGLANFRKIIAGEFLSEFSERNFPGNSSALFLQGSRPLPPKNSCTKFTPKIVGILLQFHFLDPPFFWFSRRFSACGRDQHLFCAGISPYHLRTYTRNLGNGKAPALAPDLVLPSRHV